MVHHEYHLYVTDGDVERGTVTLEIELEEEGDWMQCGQYIHTFIHIPGNELSEVLSDLHHSQLSENT